MDLDAISIEFDLMYPAVAAGTFPIEEASAGSMKPG
jgi:hypothetical protein